MIFISSDSSQNSVKRLSGKGDARISLRIHLLVVSCICFLWAYVPYAQAQTAVAPTAGDGLTTATAFQITSLGNLVWLGERASANETTGKYYQLMNNIDASDTANWNDAGTDTSVLEGFRPIGTGSLPFRGVFNGNGKKITGLSINRPNAEKVGLFGVAGYWGDTVGGRILNLTLENSSVTGRSIVGNLVGDLYGKAQNCSASGSVTGGYGVGGLAGECSSDGLIHASSASGSVTGTSSVGGLVGGNYNGTVTQSSASGSVTGSVDTGGLVGDNNSSITNCFASSTVTGNSTAGGLVGYNHYGSILNSFATGTVTGDRSVGGLVGSTYSSTIENCFATGAATGFANVGGIVGGNGDLLVRCFATGAVTGKVGVGGVAGYNYGTVTDCYWDVETTGQTTSVGSDTRFGKTTTQMKQQATFAGWNFSSVWGIAAGKSYPYLRLSPPPFRLNVTIQGPGTVAVLPQNASYAAGTEVVLTAIPADATVSFLNWTNAGITSTAQSTSLLMDTHKNVTAHFRRHYEVRTLAELQAIASGDLDGHYTLMNDIDASDTVNWNDAGTDASIREGFRPVGTPSNPTITAFRGIFDGGGKKITGLTIHRPTSSYAGLFGYIGLDAEIRNLILEHVDITGNRFLGRLAGGIGGARVENCFVTGGTVTGNEYLGGLAGSVSGATLERCLSSGMVQGFSPVGGMLGSVSSSTILKCCSSSVVTGKSEVGGLVGYSFGNVYRNCLATGAVTGTRFVGGLVGYHNTSTLENSLAAGRVTGDQFLGGLVGNCPESTVTASYWDRETTGQTSSTGSAAPFSKTTAEMRQQATFTGWDFLSTWRIAEGQSYPYLQFAPPPFRLDVSVVGPGSVALNPPGGIYAAGTAVTLTATSSAGAQFTGWVGAGTSETVLSIPCRMDAPRSVMAHFRRFYEIRTLAELQAINNTGDFDGHYTLMNDIDASATANWSDEGTTGSQGFQPIGWISTTSYSHFRGVFDGNGKKITGLTINRPRKKCVGLFASIGQGGEVRNLTLEGGTVTGGYTAVPFIAGLYVGSLAGQCFGGKIENCFTSQPVLGGDQTGASAGNWMPREEGYLTGGLVGYCYNGSIENSAAAGSVTGGTNVGGLVGYCRGSSIVNSSATGGVISDENGGGLVGQNDTSTLQQCFATGVISCPDNVRSSFDFGGLIGQNYSGILENCFATGAVAGNVQNDCFAGGLIGYNSFGSITNCYATGVTPLLDDNFFSSSGGLIGGGSPATITSCYWDVETTGQTSSKGGTGAVGKTSAEMKRQSSFTGWDFTTVWGIIENLTYPSFPSSSSSFRLNVSVAGEGVVTLDPPGGVYAPGTTVTLTAYPAAGQCFDRWLGGKGNPISSTTQVVMDGHKSVTAWFRLNHEIRTLADLQAIATGDLTGYYTLMNDLDASETANWNDAGTTTYTLEGFLPIGKQQSVPFSGVFNGNGKKITGLVINRQWSETHVALFAQVGQGGEIRNLTLEGGSVTGYRYTGGLVGTLSAGLVTHCSVRMKVTGGNEHTGGLVGYNAGGTIEDCDAGGDVTGKSWSSTVGVGGLVGINSYGFITRCSAGGTVKVTQNNVANTGGVVGVNYSGTVRDCFANGSVMEGYATGGLVGRNYSSGLIENCIAAGVVTKSYRDNKNTGGVTGANFDSTLRRCFNMGVVTGYDQTGGVAGYNGGEISDCFSNGPVKGRQAVGGLVGTNASTKVIHCFASGLVQGTSNVGGLIGSNSATSVTACYWDVQTTGQPTSTTIVGAVGKTTAEMKKGATFSGWDFAAVWGIAEGKSYPYLRGFPEPFQLTVTLIEEGPGQVILDPPGGVYAPGTTVTLTAVPQAGGRFVGWIGAVADPLAESISIVMDGPKSVIAHFGKVYEIRTLAELQAVATSDMTGYYKLMNDIDASDTASWNDDESSTNTLEGFRSIGKYSSSYPDTQSFQGVFDGNGKKITGLTINRPNYLWGDREGMGLFGLVGTGGEIKNLTLEGGNVRGYSNVGNLVGVNNGTLTNCSANGGVTGRGEQPVGGLAGINKGTIINCFAGGEVTSQKYVGGLVGSNKGSISKCFATGVITGYQSVGGLAGYNNGGSIANCFATGQVTGTSNMGGLLGENASGSVTHSFACGAVSSTESSPSGMGGLVGANGGTVTGGYWDAITTGWSVSAGSDASFGKTTAQMKQQATFAEWDFTSVWGIVEGVSYPYLRFGSGAPLLSLSVTTDGEGSVALNPPGGVYAPGTVVTLTTTAAPGYQFERWTGPVADPAATTMTLLIDTCKSVTAHFRHYYEIRTLAELQAIATSGNMMGYYKLMNDIDASDTANWNDAGTSDLDVREGFRPIGFDSFGGSRSFQGTFDGNGKKITGLTINRPNGGYVGLFSALLGTGEVRNLTLEDVRVTGAYYTGGLVGYNSSGRIENCSLGGLVKGDYCVGGLVGTHGESENASVSRSFSTAAVTGENYIGGLTGYNNRGLISECFATGVTSGTLYSVGGLIGGNRGTLQNCFATGAAIGTSSTAGLVGRNDGGSIANCFATGRVTGNASIGGLIGYPLAGTVAASYWDQKTTGQPDLMGLVGAEGKTHAEMKQQATFAGWNFTSVWGIVEGQSYPYLRFMPPPFRLSVTVDGLGSFTRSPVGTPVTSSGSAVTYAPGTTITLTAGQPGTESYFDGWIGTDGNPLTTSTTILMDTHKSVTLRFALNEYPLTIEAVNGSVVQSPNRTTYPFGSVVTLFPKPNAGYRFLEWTGDIPTGDVKKKPLMIQIRKATSIQARFSIGHPALWLMR